MGTLDWLAAIITLVVAGLTLLTAFWEKRDTAVSGLDAVNEVEYLTALARAFRINGRARKALETYRAALDQTSREITNHLLSPEELGRLIYRRSSIISAIGHMHLRVGNYSEALSSFNELRELATNEMTVGVAEHGLGRTYRSLGNFAAAADHFGRALSVARKAKDVPNTCAALRSMGILRMEQGDYSGAIRHFRESLELVRSSEVRQEDFMKATAVGERDLAIALALETKDADLLERLLDTSTLALLPDLRYLTETRIFLAEGLMKVGGDHRAAVQVLEDHWDDFELHLEVRDVMKARMLRASSFLSMGRPEDAIRDLRVVEEFFSSRQLAGADAAKLRELLILAERRAPAA